MSKHDISTVECVGWAGFNKCTSYVSRAQMRDGPRLCQEHLVYAWSIVQEQIAASNRTPPLRRGPAKPNLDPNYKPEPMPGYVYYLRVGNQIKIGHTTDICRRLASYPPASELIAYRMGSRKLEKAEHVRYDKWLEDGREWFTYSTELEADILRNDETRPEWYILDDEDDLEWKRRKPGSRARVNYRARNLI